MSEEKMQTSPFECPAWFDGKKINETVFCEEFLRDYPMVTVNDAFFTVNGRVHDENRLKKVIYDRTKYYVTSGVAKKVTNLLDVMRMECCTAKLSLYQDRIHVANGTYYLNGTFSPEKDFCRNRLPVAYNPEAPQPVTWLHFLSQLLEPEDILTLQEFMGYCFIPSTKGQKMLLLVGKGGEGKSRIGIVLRALLGSNMNTGSIAKVETSPFARADLEHELVIGNPAAESGAVSEQSGQPYSLLRQSEVWILRMRCQPENQRRKKAVGLQHQRTERNEAMRVPTNLGDGTHGGFGDSAGRLH